MTPQASKNALHRRDGQKSLQNTLAFPPSNEKSTSLKLYKEINVKKLGEATK